MYREAHQQRVIKELYSNLNHLNKLTSQLEYLQEAIAKNETVRIVYTESGQPTAAIVRDNHAIMDRKLYQTVCQSEGEAHYLTAILNSDELATTAKPFCTTNWAKKIRDFEKHGWKLPIPCYDSSDSLHVRLSELGKAAEQECTAIIANSEIMAKPAGDAQSRATRKMLRHEWQPISATALAIEVAVDQLLSDPAQAALAKRQMQTGKQHQ